MSRRSENQHFNKVSVMQFRGNLVSVIFRVMQTQKCRWISIPSCCHSFWWLTSVDSSSVNAFAAGPFPPSTALTYLPCKGAVTSSCSPHPFLHGPQLLKLASIGSRPFSKIVNDFSLLFFPLSILKSWSASPGSPHLPLLPLQLPHHSTSSTQGNPSLPRQVNSPTSQHWNSVLDPLPYG